MNPAIFGLLLIVCLGIIAFSVAIAYVWFDTKRMQKERQERRERKKQKMLEKWNKINMKFPNFAFIIKREYLRKQAR